MNKKIFTLIIASSISLAVFSQQENAEKKAFEVSATHIAVSKDSGTTTYTGNVDIKGSKFHFSKAEKVVYNRKENILLIYNCAKIVNADQISELRGPDGKKYFRYQL